jgi:FtsP/CotA-like multicopper oxidase with cupredoxin domain
MFGMSTALSMMLLLHFLFSTLFAHLSTASLLPIIDERATTTNTADPQCTNAPKTRAGWKSGYSIATNFDKKFPTTGNTVQCSLDITNGTCKLDGHGDRLCLLINKQYPGPVIRASRGDTLQITVKNPMQNNGTSIH